MTVTLRTTSPTVVLEKILESPLNCKEIQPFHPKGDQSWVFIGRTDVEAETPILWPPHAKRTHWKRPWCWEGLGAGGEGDDREWDGWMASPTRWTWVWVNSGSWWWTGMPGVLQFMGSQRVGHGWATELNWELSAFSSAFLWVTLILRQVFSTRWQTGHQQCQPNILPIQQPWWKESLSVPVIPANIWGRVLIDLSWFTCLSLSQSLFFGGKQPSA